MLRLYVHLHLLRAVCVSRLLLPQRRPVRGGVVHLRLVLPIAVVVHHVGLQFSAEQVLPLVLHHRGYVGAVGDHFLRRMQLRLLPKQRHVRGLVGAEDSGERTIPRRLPLHALPDADGEQVLVRGHVVELHLGGLLQIVGYHGILHPRGGVARIGYLHAMHACLHLLKRGRTIVLHHEVRAHLPFLAAVGEIHRGGHVCRVVEVGVYIRHRRAVEVFFYRFEVYVDDPAFAVLLHADGGRLHDFDEVNLLRSQARQHHILALPHADVVHLQRVSR